MKLILGITMFGCYMMGAWITSDHFKEQEKIVLNLQEARTASFRERSALCAKKASNFAYIIDKKLYSEESAQRIYTTCLNE